MRIAWFTPLSTRSAIGQYSKHVCEELAHRCDVDIWIPESESIRETHLRVVDFGLEPQSIARIPDYDIAVYNIGDHHGFHGAIYEVSREHAGLVILHDRTCHNLFASYWFSRNDPERYVERMDAFYGVDGRTVAQQALDGERPHVWESDHESLRFPLFEEALVGQLGALVHSGEHAERVKERWFGPVRALEFPAYPRRMSGNGSDGAEGDHVTLLTLGYVNRNKRIHRVIEVLARNPDVAERARYLIVGPSNPSSSYLRELHALVRHHDLEGVVEFLGYQPDATVERLMRSADVFVNLRFPAMESASASLVEQLSYWRPVVVYDTGSFAELPDGAVAKIPVDDFGALEAELRRLVTDSDARMRLGVAARREAERRSLERFADGLIEFLTEVRSWRPVMELSDRDAIELAAMAVDLSLGVVDAAAREVDAITGTRAVAEAIEVREIAPRDASALAAFFRRNDVPEVTTGFDPFPLTAEEAERIASEPRKDRYYAAFLDDRIVGMAMLRGWDEGYEVPSFGVVVDHRYQRCGIGGVLTDHAIAQAKELGCPRVRLSVYGRNEQAQRMYGVRGFVETSRETVERADGREERIVMVKVLADEPHRADTATA